MLFVSTRGKTDLVSASHAITRGLAGDGGLFVPKRFPQIRLGDIKAMEKKPYTERAVDILLQFLTDFTEDELRECVTNAVRYAEASALYVDFSETEGDATVSVSNNGKQPDSKISEGGGLSTLRRRVECAGGTMAVQSIPQFKLTVTVPKGKEGML